MVRILITGITGLIGKEIGKELVKSGHEIIGIARDISRAKSEITFPAKLFEWQGANAEFPYDAFWGWRG